MLGVRAFGTQLLCEQVIGRALRRQSYDLNEEDLFDVEYADVLGIPFDFTARPVVAPPQPPRETVAVRAVSPERDACEIRFPRVQGYRVELPEERLSATFDDDATLELTPDLVGPSITRNEGIVGEGVDLGLGHLEGMRPSTVVFHLTRRLLETRWRDPGEEPKLHLFGQLKRITRRWLKDHLVCKGGTYPAQLLYQSLADTACERITRGIVARHLEERPHPGGDRPLQPGRLHDARPLHHVEEDPLGDRRRPLPRQLGGLRQRVGGPSSAAWPRRIRGCVPTSRTTGSGLEVPYRFQGRVPDVRARLHRAGGRRARRGGPPAPWWSRSRATAGRTPGRRRTPCGRTGCRG